MALAQGVGSGAAGGALAAGPRRGAGRVQHDLLDAGLLPHPYEGLNSRLWEWTWERDWVYTKEFTPPPDWGAGHPACGSTAWTTPRTSS